MFLILLAHRRVMREAAGGNEYTACRAVWCDRALMIDMNALDAPIAHVEIDEPGIGPDFDAELHCDLEHPALQRAAGTREHFGR